MAADVATVSRLLAKTGFPPSPSPIVDGGCEMRTVNSIIAFQKKFLLNPDGRVEPNSETWRRLNGNPPFPSSSSGPAAGVGQFRKEITTSAQASGLSKTQIDEFFQWWEKNQLADIKKVLGSVKLADNAIKFAKFFFTLRKWGFAVDELTRIFVLVVGLNAPEVIPFIEGVLRNGARIEAGLKKAGGVRNGLGLFLLFFSLYNNLNTGEYSQAAAKIYKFAMGKAVPWASVLDTIQSFLPAPNAQSATFFKILRACDPIGLGAVAVDSFVVMVQAIIDWAMGRQFNDARLSQLVKRMKSGPTSLFAELGENAGDALYDIMQMDAKDWNQLGHYTYDQLSEFFTEAPQRRRGGATGSW